MQYVCKAILINIAIAHEYMGFFAFPPCNDPSCSCPQTSRTTRRPIEGKGAVLKHFPAPTFSALEAELAEEAGIDGSPAVPGTGWLCRAGSVLGLAGAWLSARLSRESRSPGASPGPSSCRFHLWQHAGAFGWALVLCGRPTLQWDGNTLQCSALHLKKPVGKAFLKKKENNPPFHF